MVLLLYGYIALWLDAKRHETQAIKPYSHIAIKQ